jgi:hypothetical protein
MRESNPSASTISRFDSAARIKRPALVFWITRTIAKASARQIAINARRYTG